METMESFFSPSEWEWLLITGIRQTFGIAERDIPSYAEAIQRTKEIAPGLIDHHPLTKMFESSSLRLMRARAVANTKKRNSKVDPAELAREEIKSLREELELLDYSKEESHIHAIQKRIYELQLIIERVEESRWTENQTINRDISAYETELPVSGKGQDYKQYDLPFNRALRVRILHPDPPEARSGVDLIYETYDQKRLENSQAVDIVRIAALQYKIWDEKALYTSDHPKLLTQLERMRETLCQAGLCEPEADPSSSYRLPHCCAFLRPTDKIQTIDSYKVTRAWHLPICVARAMFKPTDKGHFILKAKEVGTYSITQDSFQELYLRHMLGSRWITTEELRKIYDQIGVFTGSNTVVIHAQEYWAKPRKAG